MSPNRWRTGANLVGMAAANLLRFRLRTVVVLLCLLAAAVPLLTALAMQAGLKNQALAMLLQGPDLLVTGDDFGRPAALPLEWADEIRSLPGVIRVAPRAVGRVMIEDLPAVLVGLGTPKGTGEPLDGLPELSRGELAVGSAIAGHFGIVAGDELQIALPVEGPDRFRYRTFRVTTLLDAPDQPVWTAALILASFEDLQDIFLRRGMASELMVWCRSGYEQRIAQRVGQLIGPQARVQDREMMEAYFHGGFDQRGGAFLVYFLAALAISIMVLSLATGFGLSGRRREVAVLKSIGWETHEVLLMQMVESVLVAVIGASLAVIVALVWLKMGSAWPIDRFLMPGAEELPLFRMPYHLRWAPILLTYLFSISVTASGAVASAWRAASVDPGRVLLGGEG